MMEIKVRDGKYIVFEKKTFIDGSNRPYEGEKDLGVFNTKVEAVAFIQSGGPSSDEYDYCPDE